MPTEPDRPGPTTDLADGAAVLTATTAFLDAEGRRPRVLVATTGADARLDAPPTIAAGLAALGFDVDIAPPVADLGQIARQAVDNDVHVVVLPVGVTAGRSWGTAWRSAVTGHGGTGIVVAVHGPVSSTVPERADDVVVAFSAEGDPTPGALALVRVVSERLGHPAASVHRTGPTGPGEPGY